MSADTEEAKVDLQIYVTAEEREYLTEQARRLRMRRATLIYMLLSASTDCFARELRFEPVDGEPK